MSKQATQEERRYMSKVAELGCIICTSPACIHHIREGQGMGERSENYLVIPLCPGHHMGELSIHGSKRQFEKLFGSELDLLAKTIEVLHKMESN